MFGTAEGGCWFEGPAVLAPTRVFIVCAGILMLLAKKRPVTQGDVPPALSENLRLAALHGRAGAYQELTEVGADGGPEGGKFTPMAPYAGAPALTSSSPVFPGFATGAGGMAGGKTGILGHTSSFSLGRTGTGSSRASESTPLTSPKPSMTGMGMDPPVPGPTGGAR